MNEKRPPTLKATYVWELDAEKRRIRQHGWTFLAGAYGARTRELQEGPSLKDEKESWDDE